MEIPQSRQVHQMLSLPDDVFAVMRDFASLIALGSTCRTLAEMVKKIGFFDLTDSASEKYLEDEHFRSVIDARMRNPEVQLKTQFCLPDFVSNTYPESIFGRILRITVPRNEAFVDAALLSRFVNLEMLDISDTSVANLEPIRELIDLLSMRY